MNSYTAWRMNVVAYGVWVGLSSVAGMIILGLAICACANELQVDYSSTETTSKLPLWSIGEIIVKFENDIIRLHANTPLSIRKISATRRRAQRRLLKNLL